MPRCISLYSLGTIVFTVCGGVLIWAARRAHSPRECLGNYSVLMEQFLEIPAGDEFYFQWHLTERCNQRCAHCYHDSYASSEEMGLSDLQAVFAEMEKALRAWSRVGSFSLTGGEPFVRCEELFALMGRLDLSDVVGYYDILTNGALISDEDALRLRNAAKLRRVQLSLEGPSADINDSIRGNGTFERTLAAIDLLKSHGVEVAVMMTVTRRNKGSIARMLDLLAAHKVDTFAIERFIPEGSGAELEGAMLTAEEAREVFETVHALGQSERRVRVLMYRPLFALVDGDDPTVGAMCSVGTNALTIMHDGTVYPCRRLPISLGHVLRDGLFKIWYDSDFLWRIRDPENLADCAKCDLVAVCRGCRAMAHFASGDCFGADPHCWRPVECTA